MPNPTSCSPLGVESPLCKNRFSHVQGPTPSRPFNTTGSMRWMAPCSNVACD